MELYGSEGSLYSPDPIFFCKEVKLIDKDTEVQNIGSYEHTFAVPDKDDNGQMLANYRLAGLADIVAAIAEERPHRCSIELLFTQQM